MYSNQTGNEKLAIVRFPNLNNTFRKGTFIFKMIFTVEKLLQVHFLLSSHDLFSFPINLLPSKSEKTGTEEPSIKV